MSVQAVLCKPVWGSPRDRHSEDFFRLEIVNRFRPNLAARRCHKAIENLKRGTLINPSLILYLGTDRVCLSLEWKKRQLAAPNCPWQYSYCCFQSLYRSALLSASDVGRLEPVRPLNSRIRSISILGTCEVGHDLGRKNSLIAVIAVSPSFFNVLRRER